MRRLHPRSIAILTSLALVVALPLSVQASHSWGGYHWAKTSAEVTIPVVDSMTTDWDPILDKAIGDWDDSIVLRVVEEPGNSSNKTRKRCQPASGKVRACNAAYGFNGWLGLAQIWVKGGHIVQGVAKMNDSYFASPAYSDTNRQHVACQEIGHSWGLGHQDESGKDLDTCMDYSSLLDNPSPNDHDYEQLVVIYDHTDTVSAPKKKRGRGNNKSRAFLKANANAKSQWGRKIHGSAKGRSAVYVRDFGGGLRIFTHVTWAR